MSISALGCGGNEGNSDGAESKVCEVKAVVAGYSTDWLTVAAQTFNEMYQEEGYKIDISLMDTDIGMRMELTTPKRNTTDLYFEYIDSINSMIEKSRAVMGVNKGAILEDMSDVLSSKAIDKNKNEQGGAIKDRIDSTDIDLCKYTGSFSGFDGVYGMPCYGGSVGLYVNVKVLEEKGYSLDDFLTTDSLIEMTQALAPQGDARLDANGWFPVTWTGTSAGYWDYLISMFITQYMGADQYENFMNFIPSGGQEQMLASGYTVYEDRGIYEALKVSETLQNRDLAVPGTAGMGHIAAQARLFEGSSLYMVSGDWIYKEMEKSYSNYLNDVIAIKNPVISALGVKLGLCGQTHQEPSYHDETFVEEYSCAACETKLRAVIKAVDAQVKTDAEIASEVGVTETQVATLRERRGYYGAANGFSAMIPSYSNAKTVAKLFLRFLCSDDGIDIYFKNTYSNFIVKRVNEPNQNDYNARENAIYEKMYGVDASPICQKTTNVIRVVNGFSVYPIIGTTKAAYLQLSYSHIDTKTPSLTAKNLYLDSARVAKGNWGEWLRAAGLQ